MFNLFEKMLLGLLLLGVVACGKDDPDDGPVYLPKDLYQMVGDVSELNEIPCLDEVPSYDPSQVGSYDLAFEDSVFIEHIAMNPSNTNQWAFSKRYIAKGNPYGIGTEAVYWIDLSTGESRLIDSAGNLRSLVCGGDYVVMEQDQGCALYQVSTGKLSSIEGIHPYISPGGKWLKLYLYKDFSNQREDLFELPDMTVKKSWKYGGSQSPGSILWNHDERFLYFFYGDTFRLQEYIVDDESITDRYSSATSSFGGWPVVWLSGDQVLTAGGFEIDLDNKTEDWIYRRCENKYFDQFISIGKDGEFIGKKVYYRADHEAEKVYYSHHFHLLKPDEGLEQRLKLVFDK